MKALQTCIRSFAIQNEELRKEGEDFETWHRRQKATREAVPTREEIINKLRPAFERFVFALNEAAELLESEDRSGVEGQGGSGAQQDGAATEQPGQPVSSDSVGTLKAPDDPALADGRDLVQEPLATPTWQSEEPASPSTRLQNKARVQEASDEFWDNNTSATAVLSQAEHDVE